MSSQLTLKVGLPDSASFENFYPGANAELVNQIRNLARSESNTLFLQGGIGSGKTHLLSAATKEANTMNRSSIYLSQALVDRDHCDWLELSGEGLICIDDLAETLTSAEALALMSLYEHVKEQRGALILASNISAQQIDWNLLDLKSRIHSGLLYKIRNLSETELVSALQQRASFRGFSLSEEVLSYILRRYDRAPKSLFTLLDRIDTESLARKRRVTVALLQSLEISSV